MNMVNVITENEEILNSKHSELLHKQGRAKRWAGRLLWVSAAAADARSLLETFGKCKMVGETVITCSEGDFFIVTV